MAAKSKFNPRKLMEKAIEVMRSSVAEKRTDGKPNPLVGAVLVRSDGSIETSARGELREGNHAEFTLLERKGGAGWLGVARDQGDDVFVRVCLRHGSSQSDGAQSSQAIHRVEAFGEDRLWIGNPVSSDPPMKLEMSTSRNPPNIPPKWRDRQRLMWLFCESRQITRQNGGIGTAISVESRIATSWCDHGDAAVRA
jgi:hypothetical protein